MVETLSSKTRIARKDHKCMASEWIREGDYRSGFTFSEYRAIAKAKANNWKIKKGDSYSWAQCKYDGILYEWKAIPEIEAICHKYNYFADL